MKTFIKILRGIGEFPQCLLGFILTKIYDVKYSETYKDIDVYTGKFSGGISLGLYIIMDDDASENTKKHEGGHTRQSLRGGWLYLLTVGIVSFTWCSLRYTIPGGKNKDYYSIGPEKQADKYGGVKRYEGT